MSNTAASCDVNRTEATTSGVRKGAVNRHPTSALAPSLSIRIFPDNSSSAVQTRLFAAFWGRAAVTASRCCCVWVLGRIATYVPQFNRLENQSDMCLYDCLCSSG